MDMQFFSKGLLLGFVIAAPVGPIGIMCARRTLTHGRRAGFFSGMGAATADALYGFIAAFGLTFISNMLVGHQFALTLAGGILLCFLGIRTFISQPDVDCAKKPSGKRYAGMFTSTFFLTLTNPSTIFSFAAVFAGFGLAATKGNLISAATLILGVFIGSGLWWLFLVGVFSLVKRRFKQAHLDWVNKLAGVVIGGTGVAALLSCYRW